MNNNMTDIIERYIKELLQESNEDFVTLKRSNVAEKFDCVPSQLNYVIKTRFTPEHGFIIESKRGGGGFIRITKVTLHNNTDYIDYLIETVQNEEANNIDYAKILKILKDDKYINHFDYEVMATAIDSLYNNSLETILLVNRDDKDFSTIISDNTWENIRQLLIKFLITIKYNKEKI